MALGNLEHMVFAPVDNAFVTQMANKITALDAAMTLVFHAGRQWRGASEFHR